MRKMINSMILGLSAALALVGCGSVTDPIKEWRSEDVTIMNEVLGQAIPVAPFSSNYKISTFEHETMGTIIHFDDDTIKDRSEAYQDTLLENGYEFRDSDEYYNYIAYNYFLRDTRDGVYHFVHVQIFVIKSDDKYDLGFEIFSWFEDGGVMTEEWPESILEKVLVGTTETVPPFEADKYILKYNPNRNRFGLYGYTNDPTIESTYTSILEAAGWTIDDSIYAEGYGMVANSPKEELTVQYIYYDDTDIDDDDMLIVRIYVNNAEGSLRPNDM